MDVGRMLDELRGFDEELLEAHRQAKDRLAGGQYYNDHLRDLDEKIRAELPVIHRILRKVDPELEEDSKAETRSFSWTWRHVRTAVQQAITLLERQAEVEEMLGEAGIELHAERLHPWVWEAAKSLWNDGHHQDAVTAAAEQLDRHVQAKVDSRKRSGADLYLTAYSDKEPRPDQPRLRPPSDVDTESATYASLLNGARFFGAGCAMLVRNIATHERDSMTEQECAEALAALSLLARRVDADRVERERPVS